MTSKHLKEVTDALTPERLRELLHFEPLTGVFVWPVARKHGGRDGDVAGNIIDEGYRRIKIDGRLYLAHRLAWFYVHGALPRGDLDHVNGVKDDNRIANLRLATDSQNKANCGPSANNSSGVKGVRWHKAARKWVAQIRSNGEDTYLGCYDTPGQAALAYAIAAEKYFGEFGRPTLEDTCLGIFMDAWRDARWKFDWVHV